PPIAPLSLHDALPIFGLIDATGALDIVADGTSPTPGFPRGTDPELTNPDKLVYAEKGADPQGCMSAVAESWAKDAAKTLTAIDKDRKSTRLNSSHVAI